MNKADMTAWRDVDRLLMQKNKKQKRRRRRNGAGDGGDVASRARKQKV